MSATRGRATEIAVAVFAEREFAYSKKGLEDAPGFDDTASVTLRPL